MRGLLALALCASVSFCGAAHAAPPPAEAAPGHPRVILIGLDGASLNVLEPLVAAGHLPTLASLMRAGVAVDLASIWPLRTPQVWTTIVTGKYPGQHRIWDHYSNTRYSPPAYRTEEKRVLGTRDRRSKALWNILDAERIRVMSVGWISSWPAERLEHGVMLAPVVLRDPNRQVSIKGTFWRDAREQVQPASLWPRVQARIVEGADLDADGVRAFADLPPEASPLYDLPYLTKYVRALKWSVARATSVEALVHEFAPEARPDLLSFYFQCSDSLAHRFWIFQKSEEEIVERLSTHGIPTGHARELRQRFGRVVQACYQDFDRRIGNVLERLRGPDTLVLVVSDHGFGEAPFPHPKKTEPYGGNHRDAGVLIAAAPWIAPGTPLEGPSVLDITPTLLLLFDRPVGADMPGRVLEALLDPERRARTPQRIPSYEKKPQVRIPYRDGWPARRFRPLAEDS